MQPMIGHDRQISAFIRAMDGGNAHHGWILAGPKGLGKAQFALAAAHHILAVDEPFEPATNGFAYDPKGQTAQLLEAGSHPDFQCLRRLPRSDKIPPDEWDNLPEAELKRNISVDQIRALIPMLGNSPAISSRRVIIIDAADDLERSGANALLKSLEEPPENTFFLLVSHAPDRLLPTIRSRCRLLRFDPLMDGDLRELVNAQRPDIAAATIDTIVDAAGGSPGRALQYADADMAEINILLEQVEQGDADCTASNSLARSMAGKKADARYRAFLQYAPSRMANHIRTASVEKQGELVTLWREMVALADSANPKSLDAYMVTFRICRLMAGLAAHR